MPKIGSVKVSYRRSIQPRQYESMETQVSLDLIFAEGEDPNIDDVITGELDRVQRHVDGRLGIATKPAAKAPAKPLPKVVVKPTPVADKPATAPPGSKPKGPAKPTGKPGKPAKPAAPAPAAEEGEQGAIVYTKGDAMAAIGAAMTRLAAAGQTDGAELIDKLVLAYLPDDKPPFSYNRIPDDSLGDFISDLKKLGA